MNDLSLVALDSLKRWVDLCENGEPLGEVEVNTDDLPGLWFVQQIKQRPDNLV